MLRRQPPSAGGYAALRAPYRVNREEAGHRMPSSSADARSVPMPFKPNYSFERRERERLKQAKKEEKLRRRQQERNAQPDEPAPRGADRNAPSEGVTE